jgi:hypothetical protein
MRITLEGDDRQTLIARLGLSTDASDADLQQAVTARILAESAPTPQPAPAPGDTPTPPAAPATTPSGPQPAPPSNSTEEDDDADVTDSDDVEVVDVAAYRALVARAQSADQLEEDARIRDRDNLIAVAIRDGKFPPSRRTHYASRYDTDPDATRAAIDRMAKNVVPVKERGVDASDDQMEASDAYPTEWLGRPGAPQPAQTTTAGGGGERRSRVITED